MRTILKSLLLTGLVTAACVVHGGELSDFHFKNARHKLGDPARSRSHAEVSSTNHGIAEIGIERTGCLGTCPAYTFIMKNDGTFRYKGGKYAQRQGDFTGKIPVRLFHQVAKFIKDSGYMELEDAYTRMITDNSTTYTMVVMNGKRKVIRNYADAGPIKLWAIEQLTERLMEKVEWEKSERAQESKK